MESSDEETHDVTDEETTMFTAWDALIEAEVQARQERLAGLGHRPPRRHPVRRRRGLRLPQPWRPSVAA